MAKVVVADLTDGGASAKLVLLRMAYEIRGAREDGAVVWPSIGVICRDMHLGRATVQRAQEFLEEAGLIILVRPAHQWYPARWRVEVAAIDARRFPKYQESARRRLGPEPDPGNPRRGEYD